MSTLATICHVALLIFVVVMIFNIIIFTHELGHFLAGKWRGLQIDRFQIWFGKPLWSKTVNGVQYGLGWIPFGGFVALPQMAPMEAIEGGNTHEQPLPPVTPLDKIIVAFAGPLFSMLLALLAAVVVWQVGKPADFIPTTEIGFVLPDSPAATAGLQAGDKITAINGAPVNGFSGPLDSIMARVILSRGENIQFTVERPGVAETLTLTSGFETEKSQWFQRRGLRQVGLAHASPALVAATAVNGPAARAGLTKGDRILKVDGIPLHSPLEFRQYLKDQKWQAVALEVQNPAGEIREISLTPQLPLSPKNLDPMAGLEWDLDAGVDLRIVHPGPWGQVVESLQMMWITITSVVARDSSIGIDHLSGPVGIAKHQYAILQTEHAWRRILAFMVLFNVNLAVLNMLPFPVLDGGHITLAMLEKLARRPVKARVLEVVQTVFALLLISLMLYVTSKDVGDGFGRGTAKDEQIIFAP
ncbi:MAG: RIP metalloprotease RseP [Verrucomicrobia bacterium]|nr:RIP metalloprotease RseP [Verrucomicrobiota bacterium]